MWCYGFLVSVPLRCLLWRAWRCFPLHKKSHPPPLKRPLRPRLQCRQNDHSVPVSITIAAVLRLDCTVRTKHAPQIIMTATGGVVLLLLLLLVAKTVEDALSVVRKQALPLLVNLCSVYLYSHH